MGRLPGGYISAIEDAIEPAGAERRERLGDRGAAAARPHRRRARGHEPEARGPRQRRPRAARAPDRARRSCRAASWSAGCARSSSRRSRGDYSGLDGVVFVRDRDGLKGDEKSAQDASRTACIDGMQDTEAQVVGVEKMETDPSQVPFMRSHDITSVDDLDLPEGKTALVWALLGAGRAVRASRPPPSGCCRRRPSGAADADADRCAGCRWRCRSALGRAAGARRCWRAWSAPASCARTTAASCCRRPPGILIAVVAALAVGPLAALDELADADTLAPEVGARARVRARGRGARAGRRPARRPPAGRRRGRPGRPARAARPRAGRGAGRLQHRAAEGAGRARPRAVRARRRRALGGRVPGRRRRAGAEHATCSTCSTCARAGPARRSSRSASC